MSREALLFLGLLLTPMGLDEWLPGKGRMPVKLVVGLIALLLGLVFGNGILVG